MPPISVAKDDVLAATLRLRRLGNYASLVRLEKSQPDLLEVLLDTANDVRRRLTRAHLPPVVIRQLDRRVENLGVVLVDAVLIAHARHAQTQQRLVIPPLA